MNAGLLRQNQLRRQITPVADILMFKQMKYHKERIDGFRHSVRSAGGEATVGNPSLELRGR